MAATLTDLTATLTIQFTAVAKKAIDQSTPQDALSYNYEQSYTYGNGALELDVLWHDTRTLGAGANESIDLAGSLSDGFGDTVNLANVKILIIENTSADAASSIVVGGAAGTQFDAWLGSATDLIRIEPGESKVLISRTDADGYASTGAADDLLKILNENGGAGATYKIIVAGDAA